MPALAIVGAYGALGVFGAIRRQRWPSRARAMASVTVAAALCIPALAWDARTLTSPLSRQYPGNDDVDYVRGSSGGGPWLKLVPDLRRLSHGQPLVVASSGLEVLEYMQLALRHDQQISLVASDSPEAQRARYGFGNGTLLATVGNAPVWRPIRTYTRPRDGVPVTLYARP